MSSIQSTAAWKQLNGALHSAVDRDQEIELLPVLKAIWPGLTRPRGMKVYDRAGCDLIEQEVDDYIKTVIQCKGFYASEGLEKSQIDQILKSISAFERSSFTCKEFVLVHNRDGRNRDARKVIQNALDRLIAAGKAQKVIQWDRTQCLKAIESRLREMLSERLKEQAAGYLAELDSLFETGADYVSSLPVRSGRLLLKRNAPPRVVHEGPSDEDAVNLVERLGKAKPHQWSLLVGLFGAGKTSCALHAAKERPHEVVYVPAANLEPRQGEQGTNVLMSRITEALHIFDDYDEDEKATFQRLSGPVLRGILSADETGMTLIIDALDENRTLHSPEEITRFASVLAELRCRVVLTTREEHFRATFGNYEHLFEELSWKGGGLRDIALHELRPWTNSQITELVANALARKSSSQSLRSLHAAVEAGATEGWPPDLLAHPFFLQMIIDLVAEGAGPSRNKAELLYQWSWTKLKRDLRAARATCVPVTDRDVYIGAMEELMMRVASEMVDRSDGGYRLREAIGSGRILEIASELFSTRCTDLAAAISVTLLSPVTIKYRGAVPVRFTHRAFQEFFLAKSLARSGNEIGRYPITVRSLASEIAGCEGTMI